MMQKNNIILLLSLLFIAACNVPQQKAVLRQELNNGWQFHQQNDTNSYQATVPGTVHTDLMNNHRIPDPYFGGNEDSLQWIGDKTWIYHTTFTTNPQILAQDIIQLKLYGLDTWADVYLNDSLILEANNMYRQWILDVKSLLQPHNTLKVVFHPATTKNSQQAATVPWTLPQERGWSRKAPYHFGWDWGPRFVTCGIWQPVVVEGFSNPRLNNIQITTSAISDTMAQLFVRLHTWSPTAQTVKSSITIGDRKISTHHKIKAGNDTIMVPFAVKNPKLWWCNGQGTPYLYNVTAALHNSTGYSDTITLKYGIRTIQLIQKKDKTGKSFLFRLNGRDIFMKGANYIPQDIFTPRVTPQQYRTLLNNSALAHMNMLRVWGGGIYENDIFYNLCDSLGLLVWQDFMFACNMVPNNSEFIQNVQHEVEDQIIRLRNHPSIALWCGNNEVWEGWHHWGWQKSLNYSAADSTALWHAYDTLFHHVIPNEIKRHDWRRQYWPSSPSRGWGSPQSMTQGDSHYWGVWWGEEPFSRYKEKTGRFMSEYGFQGYPGIKTVKSFTQPQDRYITSPVMQLHQKHDRGIKIVTKFMEQHYRKPHTLEHYLYLSQLLQAQGMEVAIRAHRTARPRCMGTLYWQLNDCWPVASWSGIDSYGRWKALHHTVRRLYNNILLSTDAQDDLLTIYGVNDSISTIKGTLTAQLMRFDGQVLSSDSIQVTLHANTSTHLHNYSIKALTQSYNINKIMLVITLHTPTNKTFRTVHYFNRIKELQLPRPVIKTTIKQENNQLTLHLKSPVLAKGVWVSISDAEGEFSDNFFDLLPGEEKQIQWNGAKTPINPAASLRTITVRDTW